MKAVEKEISLFMEEYVPEYVNPHQVSISIFEDGEFLITCSLDEADEDDRESVELGFEGKKLALLIDTFHITQVSDLNKINRNHLLHLYQQGRAYIVCVLANDACDDVYYRKDGESTLISLEDKHIGSTDRDFETAADYIEVARVVVGISSV